MRKYAKPHVRTAGERNSRSYISQLTALIIEGSDGPKAVVLRCTACVTCATNLDTDGLSTAIKAHTRLPARFKRLRWTCGGCLMSMSAPDVPADASGLLPHYTDPPVPTSRLVPKSMLSSR